MQVWMLSQLYIEPINNWGLPVAASYANGHTAPRHPDTPDGWALVRCNSTMTQIEAAELDPRVQPYRTVWDVISPDTVTAYQEQGAAAGMMLCQLLSLLAKWEPGFGVQ
jgi:hypothetical protein